MSIFFVYIDATLHHPISPGCYLALAATSGGCHVPNVSPRPDTKTVISWQTMSAFFFARSSYDPPAILTQRDYSPFLCDSVILLGCCGDELGGIVTEVEPLNDHCHSRDLWPFMALF